MSENLSKLLLQWFKKNGRDLPWRVRGGAHPNPYIILLSEIMLQQTTVKTVIPYFHKFIERFPDIQSLANASEDEVLLYWQGLGYYSRARNLHKTAKIIVNDFSGFFPSDKDSVLKLKGIGPYTVASILSLAFNQPEAVVDGNVIRIICRYFGYVAPVNEILPQIKQKAIDIISHEHPADYTSAIMDLGATVCTPKNPKCEDCPWSKECFARKNNLISEIPLITKLKKNYKKSRVYIITNSKNQIFIRKRAKKGLLSGLYEFPWEEDDSLELGGKKSDLFVSHVFTHFKLELNLVFLKAEKVELDGFFENQDNLDQYPFSTLIKKVYKTAQKKLDK